MEKLAELPPVVWLVLSFFAVVFLISILSPLLLVRWVAKHGAGLAKNLQQHAEDTSKTDLIVRDNAPLKVQVNWKGNLALLGGFAIIALLMSGFIISLIVHLVRSLFAVVSLMMPEAAQSAYWSTLLGIGQLVVCILLIFIYLRALFGLGRQLFSVPGQARMKLINWGRKIGLGAHAQNILDNIELGKPPRRAQTHQTETQTEPSRASSRMSDDNPFIKK